MQIVRVHEDLSKNRVLTHEFYSHKITACFYASASMLCYYSMLSRLDCYWITSHVLIFLASMSLRKMSCGGQCSGQDAVYASLLGNGGGEHGGGGGVSQKDLLVYRKSMN